MYFKFIKFVVLLSLLVCCGFAGRVLYSCLFNVAVQGKDPRHRVFPTSANQPNEMALTICHSISRNCCRLMRDWKLERIENGKEISAVPFRTEKRTTSGGSLQFPNGNSGKLPYSI